VKNSIQISPPLMVLILAGLFALLVVFGACWFSRAKTLSHLAEQESALRSDLEQLDTWGKWTIDYVKIDRALNYLSKNKLTQGTRTILAEQIWKISRSYYIDPLLILAVVAQESRGNPNARGRGRSGKETGAMGLMQIKLETAQLMGARFGLIIESTEDLLRPEVNVAVGSAYLIRLLGKYGNLKSALMAYNLGHAAVDKMIANGQPIPSRYYDRVISKYWELARLSF
jgi:soluble lytic murein transglycosylase-like protein